MVILKAATCSGVGWVYLFGGNDQNAAYSGYYANGEKRFDHQFVFFDHDADGVQYFNEHHHQEQPVQQFGDFFGKIAVEIVDEFIG